MKVFISWSGPRGKLIGAAFRTWLPDVIQAVEPFYSPDIEKGERWSDEIAQSLRQCKVGIICVTPESMLSPWLMFESGAISNAELTKVCPLLFQLDPGQLQGPLGQFQATPYSESEVRQLVSAINGLLPVPLAEGQLSRVFDRCWPELEASIVKALETAPGATKPEKRTIEEMLEETLSTVRMLANGKPDDDTVNHWIVSFRHLLDFGAQINSITYSTDDHDGKQLAAVTFTINHLRLMLNLAQPKISKSSRYKEFQAEAKALMATLNGTRALLEL